MEKKVVLNLHGLNIVVILFEMSIASKSAHYTYGRIYYGCPYDRMKIETIRNYLEKIFSYKLLNMFAKEDLYGENHCYILGEKHNLILPHSHLNIQKGDIVALNYAELNAKLKYFALDILTSRVRKYEVIMKTNKKHQIKITNMYAARGKNYIRKGLITFGYELVHFSLDLMDAIVIHELAHDFEANHSQAFYKIVYTYCPDYDIRIKKLNFGVKK